ncbi:MAG: acylneuraminate cytidylyltransferase family protein [Coxiellaceae bacterium]|nr:acylneuraminate cytidylyltransferase family protein [Coxiellaceae bacterium]MDF1865537.1 acylneuraminate cytidylyltransferase family protein [Saprospiraceae bacterium]
MRKDIIAVIPARGGSKGLPGKNILHFCGHPLIGWSIMQAQMSDNISSVWVSSDDPDILRVAENYGANTIARPGAISGDIATSESAWLHALDYFKERNINCDMMLGMQATSPLRSSNDLDNAIELFVDQKCDTLFSASELEDFLIWERDASGNLSSFNYDYNNRGRRQDRASQLVENGSFYLFYPEILKKFNNRLSGKIGYYLMDFWKSFEIDTYEDFELCEQICSVKLNENRELLA